MPASVIIIVISVAVSLCCVLLGKQKKEDFYFEFLFNILVDTDINNRRVKTTKIEMNE